MRIRHRAMARKAAIVGATALLFVSFGAILTMNGLSVVGAVEVLALLVVVAIPIGVAIALPVRRRRLESERAAAAVAAQELAGGKLWAAVVRPAAEVELFVAGLPMSHTSTALA